MRSTDLELLKQGQWFGGLPAGLQASLVGQATIRTFRRSEFLIREGEQGRGLFALLGGRTRHVRSAGDGHEVLLHVGEPGVWFGEYALLCRRPAAGSVVADLDSRALFLPAAEFERIVDDEPRHLRPFAALLGERFATLYRYAAEAHVLDPEEWLRTRLAGLVEMRRLDSPSQQPATLTLSQAELAGMIGLSRQRLSVLLRRLQERGLIEVGYRRIRVIE